MSFIPPTPETLAAPSHFQRSPSHFRRSLPLAALLLIVWVSAVYLALGTATDAASLITHLLVTSAAALAGVALAVMVAAAVTGAGADAAANADAVSAEAVASAPVAPAPPLTSQEHGAGADTVAHAVEPAIAEGTITDATSTDATLTHKAIADGTITGATSADAPPRPARIQPPAPPEAGPGDALERALRRQRRESNHASSVLNALADGVVIRDQQGQVMFVNDAARALLPDESALEETSPAASLDFTGQDAQADALGAALAPDLYTLGETREIATPRQVLHAQTVALVEPALAGSGAGMRAGVRVGTVTLLRDVTAVVRRERAQAAILQQLEETEPMPALYAAEVGAGLARPTTATPAVPAMHEPVERFARELRRNAITLHRLIADMRDLTQADAPLPAQRAAQSIVLETLVWSVANEWHQIARAAEIRLDVVIGMRGLAIRGDERRLRWAIGNLIENAIRYTAPGGACSLEIMGSEPQGEASSAVLRVRDNGVGISPQDMPHVFDRFYRGTPHSADGEALVVPGAGQGLAVARQIVEAHQGRMWLKSRPGLGTAVFFSLPLVNVVAGAPDGDDGLPRLPFDADDTLAGGTQSLRGTPPQLPDDLDGETELLD